MPLKIVLSGPPAVGKSTTAKKVKELIPGCLSFDLENLRVKEIVDGKLKEIQCGSAALQNDVFNDVLAHASFGQHFFLSPGCVCAKHVLSVDGWKCALLLPANREHYFAAVKLRAKRDWGKDDDDQKYQDHYKHYSDLAEKFRNDRRVMRIDRLNADGSERPIRDTVAEICSRFGIRLPD